MAEHGARRRRRGGGRRIRLDVRVDESEHRGLVERARERGVSIARLMIDAALRGPAEARSGREGLAGVEGVVARRRQRGDARAIRLEVRVDEAEHRDLAERARRRGVSVARLMVDAARDVPLPSPPAATAKAGELTGLVERLERVHAELALAWARFNSTTGNNLNQLAHWANEARQSASAERLENLAGEVEAFRDGPATEAIKAVYAAAIAVGRAGG